MVQEKQFIENFIENFSFRVGREAAVPDHSSIASRKLSTGSSNDGLQLLSHSFGSNVVR